MASCQGEGGSVQGMWAERGRVHLILDAAPPTSAITRVKLEPWTKETG